MTIQNIPNQDNQVTNVFVVTPDLKKQILIENNLPYDRLVRESEREKITGKSRSEAWRLEKLGLFPQRKNLGAKSCGWSLVELLAWINNPPLNTDKDQPTKRRGFANGSY